MIGLLTGIMLAQPSIDRTIDDLKEARSGASDELIEMKNTDVSVSSAMYNNTTSVLNVSVMNTGSTVIGAADIDILVNGTLVDTSADDGLLLYPGKTWKSTVRNITDPASLRIVGPWGISDTITTFEAG